MFSNDSPHSVAYARVDRDDPNTARRRTRAGARRSSLRETQGRTGRGRSRRASRRAGPPSTPDDSKVGRSMTLREAWLPRPRTRRRRRRRRRGRRRARRSGSSASRGTRARPPRPGPHLTHSIGARIPRSSRTSSRSAFASGCDGHPSQNRNSIFTPGSTRRERPARARRVRHRAAPPASRAHGAASSAR